MQAMTFSEAGVNPALCLSTREIYERNWRYGAGHWSISFEKAFPVGYKDQVGRPVCFNVSSLLR